MITDTEDEFMLLGACLIQAQKLEFGLYGVASHMSHLPEAKKESRFKNLTPEKFLRGDIKELKATLGQITTAFGEKLSLASPELDNLIDDRNTIVHNYWRLTRGNGNDQINDPRVFLLDFLENCIKWNKIVLGLIATLKHAAAEKEGRVSEVNRDEDFDALAAYAIFRHERNQPKQ